MIFSCLMTSIYKFKFRVIISLTFCHICLSHVHLPRLSPASHPFPCSPYNWIYQWWASSTQMTIDGWEAPVPTCNVFKDIFGITIIIPCWHWQRDDKDNVWMVCFRWTLLWWVFGRLWRAPVKERKFSVSSNSGNVLHSIVYVLNICLGLAFPRQPHQGYADECTKKISWETCWNNLSNTIKVVLLRYCGNHARNSYWDLWSRRHRAEIQTDSVSSGRQAQIAPFVTRSVNPIICACFYPFSIQRDRFRLTAPAFFCPNAIRYSPWRGPDLSFCEFK